MAIKNKEIKEFVDYCNSFKESYFARDREIDQLMFGILTKEHILFKGAAGLGKSELVHNFFKGITSTRIFSQQFSAEMDETYIFGPQLIEELKKGLIRHNVKDSIVDVDFAFLDEFFNANEETIIACNSVLNEREFKRNGQQIKAPLLSAVMTTNQNREDEEKLKPIYDRIMFVTEVQPIDKKDRIKLYGKVLNKTRNKQKEISLSTLKVIHTMLEEIIFVFPEEFLLAFDNIISAYSGKQGKYFSTRKMIWSLELMKAASLLKSTESSPKEILVEPNVLYKLKLVLTDGDKEDTAIFDSICSKEVRNISKSVGYSKFLSQVTLESNEFLAEYSESNKKFRLDSLSDPDNITLFNDYSKRLKTFGRDLKERVKNNDGVWDEFIITPSIKQLFRVSKTLNETLVLYSKQNTSKEEVSTQQNDNIAGLNPNWLYQAKPGATL